MNVTLELIDAASGAAIATDEVRIETLPERFEGLDTHLTVGEAQYSVVGADPSSREDIAKAGRVRLLLTRVEQVDPRTILFSVPTLEDSSAPIEPTGDHASAIAIHEDDWRQIELLSAAQREAVDAVADIPRGEVGAPQGPRLREAPRAPQGPRAPRRRDPPP